jgi:hypothetical protein
MIVVVSQSLYRVMRNETGFAAAVAREPRVPHVKLLSHDLVCVGSLLFLNALPAVREIPGAICTRRLRSPCQAMVQARPCVRLATGGSRRRGAAALQEALGASERLHLLAGEMAMGEAFACSAQSLHSFVLCARGPVRARTQSLQLPFENVVREPFEKLASVRPVVFILGAAREQIFDARRPSILSQALTQALVL